MTQALTSGPHTLVDKSGKLDSWKEVAAYLKRDVTTVQRWERREGFPIHRHVHDKRGSVYAYREEVDAWLLGRGTTERGRGRSTTAVSVPLTAALQMDRPSSKAAPIDATDLQRRRRRPGWIIAALLTIVPLVAIGVTVRSYGYRRGVPTHVGAAWRGGRST